MNTFGIQATFHKTYFRYYTGKQCKNRYKTSQQMFAYQMMPLLVQNTISFLKTLISLQRIDTLVYISLFTTEKRKCTCRRSLLCTSLWIVMISRSDEIKMAKAVVWRQRKPRLQAHKHKQNKQKFNRDFFCVCD